MSKLIAEEQLEVLKIRLEHLSKLAKELEQWDIRRLVREYALCLSRFGIGMDASNNHEVTIMTGEGRHIYNYKSILRRAMEQYLKIWTQEQSCITPQFIGIEPNNINPPDSTEPHQLTKPRPESEVNIFVK